eukprot:CAMPEP_0179005142 /NCGR_PEP_ID=MMETSP0795-20121207/13740_1 /TAXON_ID=88552 /ORGANISM="Amoebophrya sp., Strain Ameob2" /LENGTH=748 /DNA_ID=CAMNT_0020699571 /DNA_START=38 /DNA_END=2284 /DNA_ORIENTATION=-
MSLAEATYAIPTLGLGAELSELPNGGPPIRASVAEQNPLHLQHAPGFDKEHPATFPDSWFTLDTEPTRYNPPWVPPTGQKLKCPTYPPPPKPVPNYYVFDDLKDLLVGANASANDGAGASSSSSLGKRITRNSDFLARIGYEYEKLHGRLRALLRDELGSEPFVKGEEQGSDHTTQPPQPVTFHERMANRVAQLRDEYAEFQDFLAKTFKRLEQKATVKRPSRVTLDEPRAMDPFAVRVLKGELKILDEEDRLQDKMREGRLSASSSAEGDNVDLEEEDPMEPYWRRDVTPWREGLAKMSMPHAFDIADWNSRKWKGRGGVGAGAGGADDPKQGAAAADGANTSATDITATNSPAEQAIRTFEKAYGPIQEKSSNEPRHLLGSGGNKGEEGGGHGTVAAGGTNKDHDEQHEAQQNRGACQILFEDVIGEKLLGNDRMLMTKAANKAALSHQDQHGNTHKPLNAGCPYPPVWVGRDAYPDKSVFPDPLGRKIGQLSHDLWLLRSFLFLPNESSLATEFVEHSKLGHGHAAAAGEALEAGGAASAGDVGGAAVAGAATATGTTTATGSATAKAAKEVDTNKAEEADFGVHGGLLQGVRGLSGRWYRGNLADVSGAAGGDAKGGVPDLEAEKNKATAESDTLSAAYLERFRKAKQAAEKAAAAERGKEQEADAAAARKAAAAQEANKENKTKKPEGPRTWMGAPLPDGAPVPAAGAKPVLRRTKKVVEPGETEGPANDSKRNEELYAKYTS